MTVAHRSRHRLRTVAHPKRAREQGKLPSALTGHMGQASIQ